MTQEQEGDKPSHISKSTERKEQSEPIDTQDSIDAEVQELKELTQRIQAEFENYKKRSVLDAQRMAVQAKVSVIRDLLPLLDTFNHALKASQNNDLKTLYDQVIRTFEKLGVRPVKSSGLADPEYHEVLLKETSEEEEGTILEVLQEGYMFNTVLLRPARVKVSSGAGDDATNK